MIFETTRLILRKPIISDATDIFNNYAQDSEVTRYLVWKPHENINITKSWIKECIDTWDENVCLPFVLWHKESEQTIGMIDFRFYDFRIQIGYVLAKSFWNKGLMTEAGKAIIDALILRDDIFRIEAVHDLENTASGRVMEKLGMKYEGILRRYSRHPNISNIPRDCKIYAIVK